MATNSSAILAVKWKNGAICLYLKDRMLPMLQLQYLWHMNVLMWTALKGNIEYIIEHLWTHAPSSLPSSIKDDTETFTCHFREGFTKVQ